MIYRACLIIVALCGTVQAVELDLSAFDGQPITATAVDLSAFGDGQAVDLSAFDGANLDLSAFDGKPAVKPSPAALDYPKRSSNWTHPGNTKEGLIDHLLRHPNHGGKFAPEMLQSLDYRELESLHSDDHEGRRKPVAIAEAPRKSAATSATGTGAVNDSPRSVGTKPTNAPTSPPTWGNVTSFQWLDGVYRSTPQPGANYPTLGGVLVPLGSSPVRSSQPVNSVPPVYVRGPCPGGFCPVK